MAITSEYLLYKIQVSNAVSNGFLRSSEFLLYVSLFCFSAESRNFHLTAVKHHFRDPSVMVHVLELHSKINFRQEQSKMQS